MVAEKENYSFFSSFLHLVQQQRFGRECNLHLSLPSKEDYNSRSWLWDFMFFGLDLKKKP